MENIISSKKKMDKLEKLDILRFTYTVSLKELEKAKINIGIFAKQIDGMIAFICREFENLQNREMYSSTFVKVLNDLKYMSDILRQFNEDCAFIHELCMMNSLKKKESTEQFTFLKPNLNKYQNNYELECVITYIKSRTNELFYINDTNNLDYIDCIKKLNNYKNNTSKVLNHHPEEGEIFGLIFDDYMFRAVRENNESYEAVMKAYLIDTGEIVDITPDMNLFCIPNECKLVPSQAILCKLEAVNSNHDMDLGEYLCDRIFTKVKLSVLKNDKSIIHMNLINVTNPFIDCLQNEDNGEVQKDERVLNPFSSYYCDSYKSNISLTEFDMNNDVLSSYTENIQYNRHEKLDAIKSQIQQQNGDHSISCKDLNESSRQKRFVDNESMSSAQHFNNYNLTTPYDEYRSKNILDETNEQKINKNNKNQELLENNLKILQDEPTKTTNALKAVLGYVPKDDKKICRFYDPKIGCCFKGSRCKLEHIEKLYDGWTRDKAETMIDLRNKLIYPSKGDIVNLLPLYVIDINSFYAHLHNRDSQHQLKIDKLVSEMNSEKQISQYVLLDSSPVPLQLVIATHRNDNIWYRARIDEILNDFTYKVFYVDFGDTDIVNIQQIRKWNSKFNYLPFQAIKCEIIGIQKMSMRKSGIEQLKKMILYQILKAKILDILHDDVFLVQLYDVDGYNVGDQLILMGYVDKKQTKFICPNQILPG